MARRLGPFAPPGAGRAGGCSSRPGSPRPLAGHSRGEDSAVRARPAAFIERKGRILLLRYEYAGGPVHSFPGGSPEEGESLEEALRRECEEELGIRIALSSVAPLLLLAETEASERFPRTLHVLFRCDLTEGEPHVRPEETGAADAEWIPAGELGELVLYPNLTSCLSEVLAREDLRAVYLPRLSERPWR